MITNSNFVVKKYPLDLAQTQNSNKIYNEEHDLDSNDFPIVIPLEGSFYNSGITIKLDDKLLKLGIDYQLDALNYEATELSAKSVYDAIVFRRNLKGKLTLDYHVIGEPWVNRVSQIQQLYKLYLGDHRPVLWENITGKPDGFPCIDHHHYGWDIKDWGSLTIAVIENTRALVNLHSSYEVRLDQLLKNAINETKLQLNSVIDLINNNSSKISQLKNDVKMAEDTLRTLSDDFYAEDWVPQIRTINNKLLDKDIRLDSRDVGAISSTYKDTFIYGFNDNLTNIGKQDNVTIRYFNSISEFMDLPIGFHGYVASNGIVNLPTNRGWLHKVGSGELNEYMFYIFYEEAIPPHSWYLMVYKHDVTLNWRKSTYSGVPGEVKAYFSIVPPDNHAFLDGRSFDMKSNPICAKIFPSGNFPDTRGLFLRGLDGGRKLDCEYDREIGSYQHDRTQHVWGIFSNTMVNTAQIHTEGAFYDTGYEQFGDGKTGDWGETRRFGFDNSKLVRVGPEETVKNLAVNWIIMLG